jgi:S-disulfanyl-L-cysteine oxidoreductase SoxD
MPMSRLETLAALLLMALTGCGAQAASGKLGIGRAATDGEIAGWNIDIGRDGKELPPGSGSVQDGRRMFEEKCASCHGQNAEGGIGDRLVGGQGTLTSAKPVKTVGSFWPYAPTLFDYIRRAMPMNAPQSLSNQEVYALSAYILNLNGLVPENATLDARSLAEIRMPNRNGFVADPRPDVKDAACSVDCRH